MTLMLDWLSGNGKLFPNVTRRVIVRHATAVAVKDVMALDTTLASSSTTSGYSSTAAGGGTLGSSTGNSALAGVGPGGGLVLPPDLGYSGIITPLGESDTVQQIYCVVTSLLNGTGLDGQEVEVTLFGRVKVKVASATYVVGSIMMMSATESNRELIAFAAGTTDGQRPLAMVEIGGTSVTEATVLFDGTMGFGVSQATTN